MLLFRDPDNFINYGDITLYLVQRIISISKYKQEYETGKAGLQILIAILENLKGKVDLLFVNIIQFIKNELINESPLKQSLLELVLIF